MPRRRRSAFQPIVLSSLVVLVCAIGGTSASAEPVGVTFDSESTTLTKAETGWTAKVGVTNLDTAALTLTATAKDCNPVVEGLPVRTGLHKDLTVRLPVQCHADADSAGFVFTVTAGAQSQDITAKTAPSETVDWKPFEAFLVALGAALVLVMVIWGASVKPCRPIRLSPLTPIKGLSASWTFKDSWLTNLTAISGLLTAVVGSSDFLKAVLGDDATTAVGGATIAGLAAVALTGAAGVLVQTIKKPGTADITVGGLLAGSAVAFGAAGGQIWTITFLLLKVDLGFAKWVLVVAAILASLLLVAYAYVSLLSLLMQGTKPAKTEPLTEVVPPEVYAAAIHVAAQPLSRTVDHLRVEKILEALKVPTTDDVLATAARGSRALIAPPEAVPLSERSALP